MKLSIIIPVYYNEDTLEALYRDLMDKVIMKSEYDYEIVMVNDGSKDRSYSIMKEISDRDTHVKVISLSRNFGSHAAILCGLANCTGDCAAIKAADLQEPSELIVKMVESWKEGNKVVLAVREGRQEEMGQKIFAGLYYRLIRKTAFPQMPKDGFDVYLLDRKVIDVLMALDERNSALTGQILWTGFRTAQVPYIRLRREQGISRWTLKKKMRLVSDTLFSFSTVPITVVVAIGSISFLIACCWSVFVLIAKLKGNILVSGWTTLFILNLFSFGIIMVTLGILGGYLWRVFDASRRRPVYIIEEEYRHKKDQE